MLPFEVCGLGPSINLVVEMALLAMLNATRACKSSPQPFGKHSALSLRFYDAQFVSSHVIRTFVRSKRILVVNI